MDGTFIGDTEAIYVGEDDLDFSGESMVITPSTDTSVMSSVTIERPSALRPENIVAGVIIAGVEGTCVAEYDGMVTVTFCDYDGTILYTRFAFEGDTIACPVASNTISAPADRPDGDSQIYGSWEGWAFEPGVEANSAALQNISGDTTLYAAYQIVGEVLIPRDTYTFTYDSQARAWIN